ncbi:DNA processing protein DprA, partial [Bifidobacteriaceae bacterium WP022]
MNTKNINNTDNTEETISVPSDFSSPDEETISRAILTFCLEGADAIMYTLLLGSKSAKEIVSILKTIVKNYTKQQSTG